MAVFNVKVPSRKRPNLVPAQSPKQNCMVSKQIAVITQALSIEHLVSIWFTTIQTIVTEQKKSEIEIVEWNYQIKVNGLIEV